MLHVEMLSTGDEVLHGQIIDTNSAWLSDYFFQQGLPLTARSTAGDDLQQLVEILTLRSRFADVLIVNGGLGPTKDDLSAEAAALALGVSLKERPEWTETMKTWFADRGREMAESNIKQAMLPEGAELIDNPVGTACGFSINLNDCLIFFTPGVPSEFKIMTAEQIMPRIRARFTLPEPPLCLRLTSFGRTESGLAQALDPLTLPENVVIGYRSASPIIEIKLTGPAEQRENMNALWQEVRAVVGENRLYEGVSNLPEEIARALKQRNLTVCTVEQFTAGLLHLQLSNAGAELKGGCCLSAVSPSLAALIDAARDAKRDYGADIALVVGARDSRFIDLALSTPDSTCAFRVGYNGYNYRLGTQQQTVAMLALDTLRRWLNGWKTPGTYEWLEVVELKSFDEPKISPDTATIDYE